MQKTKRKKIVNIPNQYNKTKPVKTIKIDLGAGKNPRIDVIQNGNGSCETKDQQNNTVQLPHQWRIKGHSATCERCNAQGERFISVDILDFEGVDIVCNLGKDKWPWKDNSVDVVHASHFVEHLEANERIHFANELYRVMKKTEYDNGVPVRGVATIITPHWASQRAYGDMTHKFPPVSEFWFYYLDKDWRVNNCPHLDFTQCGFGYKCNFGVTWAYNLHPELAGRNQEYQVEFMKWNKEACSDIIATFLKK